MTGVSVSVCTHVCIVLSSDRYCDNHDSINVCMYMERNHFAIQLDEIGSCMNKSVAQHSL